MSKLDAPPAETAAALGLDLVLPGPDELLLDIDDDASMARLVAATDSLVGPEVDEGEATRTRLTYERLTA